MKTIHFVTGSVQTERIRFINQKGGSPYSFNSLSPHPNLELFMLSIEDALSKNDVLFIETPVFSEEMAKAFTDLSFEKNIQFVSFVLLDKTVPEDFAQSERDFSNFMQIPHSKIYFDFFPKK